jgi:hypothetical protein
VHAEWVEEREKEKQAFVHETATPLALAPETLAEYMEDYMDSPKPTLETEKEDTESVESAEEKENRMWSDFKLAMMAAFTALLLGVYMCRTVVC